MRKENARIKMKFHFDKIRDTVSVSYEVKGNMCCVPVQDTDKSVVLEAIKYLHKDLSSKNRGPHEEVAFDFLRVIYNERVNLTCAIKALLSE